MRVDESLKERAAKTKEEWKQEAIKRRLVRIWGLDMYLRSRDK